MSPRIYLLLALALPTALQWRNSTLVGGLMVFVAMNLIGFAQKLGIGSGLMATVVTTMPMWLALWSRLGGERVPLTSWIGLALGVAGALLLAMEGDFSATWLGGFLAFGAPLAWSVGSYASRKLSLPAPAMASAAQWFAGGAMGLVVALWFEPISALAHEAGFADHSHLTRAFRSQEGVPPMSFRAEAQRAGVEESPSSR